MSKPKRGTDLSKFKMVTFQPQNFGGYTSAMIFCGLFLGYVSPDKWWYFIASVIMFFIGMWFFSLDNNKD